jgi:molybdopterin biosynthesis enzyme MoaB
MDSTSQSHSHYRVGIIAVSHNDDVLSNVGQAAWERSGAQEVEEHLPAAEYRIIRPLVVRGGKQKDVEKILRDWCDAPNAAVRCDLILTCGGDGFEARDVMPDAVNAVIEKAAPGLAEMLRVPGHYPNAQTADNGNAVVPAAMARNAAGVRGQTLIVNLPGSYQRLADSVLAILPYLPGILDKVCSGA